MDPTPIVAIAMVAAGLWQIFWPKSFTDIFAYFRTTYRSATPEQAWRLSRVLEARVASELGGARYSRISGAFALCLAVSVFVLKVPILVTFGVWCFGTALILTLAYGEFRRPTQRRAAPLARRSPLRTLSPIVLANAAFCAFAGLQLFAFPQWRLGVVALLGAETIVLFLAWRIAAAPARLLGEDPEVESVVDERIRYCRVNAIAFGAAIPLYAVVTMTGWYAPHSDYYAFLRFIVGAAFTVTCVSLLLPMWKPLAFR